ncbi:hypothetical protein ACFIJ5_09585 [Haloimpatiens sp. FM7330]|uniref:hypothetical protein n=1 Tax=Haloimpatiens sp. FM7330 TaxID=3298610 RepID=UPI00363F0EDE
MNKKEIIELVEEVASINNFCEIIENKDNKSRNSKKIGTSQFRDIANMCKNADCSEEIKLLIQYKTTKGNGWNNKIPNKNNGKKFGNIIVDYIEKIEVKFDKDEKSKLDAISKFFGYLFWKAKVVKSK